MLSTLIPGVVFSYYRIFRAAKIPLRLALLACVLIALSSMFQLVGLGLVVPVLNGLVDETSFVGIRTTPVLGWVIRNLPFEQSNTTIFIFMVILIFSAVVLENVSLYYGRFFTSKIARDLTSTTRIQLFSKLIRVGREYFDHKNLSEINSIIVLFVNSLSVFTTYITMFGIYGFLALVYLVLMFSISWQLTLIAMILLPITHLFAQKIGRKIQSSSSKELVEVLSISNKVDEVFSNISLVQLENKEKAESEIFKEYALEAGRHGNNVRMRGFLVPSVLDVINALGALMIVSVSVLLFVTFNSFSLGRLLVFFVALRRFTSTAQQLSSAWVCSVAEGPALQALSETLFSEPPKITGGSLDCPKLERQIQFQNVSFAYESRNQVLNNLTFTVPAKSITALVGPTGGGKSTIVHLLPRFYNLSSGQILFDDIDYTQFELASLRKKIALVSQREVLFNSSIRDNICYGLDRVDPEQYQLALKQAQLTDMINNLPEGDQTLVGSHGGRLSGGEKQRIQIARAILKDPEILILDEPTSSLDAKTEAEFEEALKTVLPGRTVFVIAHRIKTVKSANQILFIESGQIVEQGTYQKLLDDNKKFADYCRLQHLL